METLLQKYSHEELVCQGEFYDKQTRIELFKKRRRAATKERGKIKRTQNLRTKESKNKNKHHKHKLVHQ